MPSTKRPTTPVPAEPVAILVTGADVTFLHQRGGILARNTATGAVMAIASARPTAGYAEVMDAETVYSYLAEFVTPAGAAAQITAELQYDLVSA